MKNTIQLDTREMATVLAALRMWQFHHGDKKSAHEVPTIFREHFDGNDPLTAKQIDGLCERLNLAVA